MLRVQSRPTASAVLTRYTVGDERHGGGATRGAPLSQVQAGFRHAQRGCKVIASTALNELAGSTHVGDSMETPWRPHSGAGLLNDQQQRPRESCAITALRDRGASARSHYQHLHLGFFHPLDPIYAPQLMGRRASAALAFRQRPKRWARCSTRPSLSAGTRVQVLPHLIAAVRSLRKASTPAGRLRHH